MLIIKNIEMDSKHILQFLPGTYELKANPNGKIIAEATSLFNHLTEDSFVQKELRRKADVVRPVVCKRFKQVQSASAAELYTIARNKCSNPFLDQEQVVEFLELNKDQIVSNSYVNCFIKENDIVLLCSVALIKKKEIILETAFVNFSKLSCKHKWSGKLILPVN